MPRFILIDNTSGFIMGDTADFGRGVIAKAQTPLEAARELDQDVVGEYGRTYEECGRHALASNEVGYHVYAGGFAPVVENGQDQATIDAVERDCTYLTTIRVTESEG